MQDLELLLRGFMAGLMVAVPVGPVNVLCISRTIKRGPRAGLISGLGAATGDTLYGAIAGFSISAVIGPLIRNEFWIRLVGGILLIGIGAYFCFRRPGTARREPFSSAHSEYVSALLLNLTNPTVILSFLAILAGLGLLHPREWWLTLLVVAGIFLGAMAWWSVLAFLANRFREKFTDRAFLWINRVAGLAIAAFGVAAIAFAGFSAK
jgi:threonine/homoserine/homoserine lactone efflux protein